jgi:ribose transport system substrate-binding protein
LKAALKKYPKVKLLEDQTANWDQNQAQKLTQTFITKYGKKITGVWTANDSMALGAVAALAAKGMKSVPVVGTDGTTQALKLIAAGDGKSGLISTSVPGGAVQGGFGLAIGYAAATGAYKVASAPADHRAFYLKTAIATKANIKATLALANNPVPSLNFSDIWSAVGDVIPEDL